MRATPSFTSRTSPTSSTFSSSRYCSISRSSTSLISLARSWVSVLDMCVSRSVRLSVTATCGAVAATVATRQRHVHQPMPERQQLTAQRSVQHAIAVPDDDAADDLRVHVDVWHHRFAQDPRQLAADPLLGCIIGLVRQRNLRMDAVHLLVEQRAILARYITQEPLAALAQHDEQEVHEEGGHLPLERPAQCALLPLGIELGRFDEGADQRVAIDQRCQGIESEGELVVGGVLL